MNETDFDARPNPDELQGLLRRAVDAIRAAPPPTAGSWQRRYSQTLAGLDPPRAATAARRRKTLRRLVALAAGAVVVAGVWFGVLSFTEHGPDTEVFAQALHQIKEASGLTCKVTWHSRATGVDGKTWTEVLTCQRVFKTPGLYRSTELDEQGQVRSVQILDLVHGRELTWNAKEKKARLRELEPKPSDSGMIAWFKEKLAVSDWQWVEKRHTATGQVNVFRHTFKELYEDPFYKENAKQRDSSYDVWIDEKTKRLVQFQLPGADIDDFDQHPTRSESPESHSGETLGVIYSDIVFDAKVDDLWFRFYPPAGYAIEYSTRPQVTEKEMVEYLGIIAECRNNTFPHQVSKYPFFPVEWVNEVMNKANRTAAEEKFVSKHIEYQSINQMPFARFAECKTVENTFRYLGNGVKLGDKDRIVCWYKLKGAKDPNTYRVVYGDLTVKDVAPEALPLPVEP